ncbi:MAG: NADH-quinone oxidoreductase subunit N [Actinomycetota bacterium]|nr:NADH-quinone oxidoreductase subunit N [Actinomycetota bacterium]
MSLLTLAAAAHHIKGPHIDWASLMPFVVLGGGALIVLMVGLLSGSTARERMVPLLTVLALAGAIAAEIARFHHDTQIVAGALVVDDLALTIDLLCAIAAIACVIMSWRTRAPQDAGHGEYHALLLFSLLGMAVLVSAQELITLFIGIELLSIPLYVLCASEHRREGSLESGLKYLVIGSVGSATLLYGLAMVYGATGQTGFAAIGTAVSSGKLSGGALGDPLLFTGLGLVLVGFAFKASVAPFHQWTPDVYQGAPTPITAFMATATKAAALGIFLRFFDVAAIGAQNTWAPMVAAVGAVTIIVGNVGALGQTSMKRMLGYSGVAQAGYLLSGVIVGTQLGVQATVFYLLGYLAMNLAAFATIVAVEHDTGNDELGSLAGLGSRRPWLAWPLTIAMLSLAGIPGTVGFIGKFQLIHGLVNGSYTWYAIVLVIGSMISLGYYLRVIATMWMGSPSTDPAYAGAGPGAGAAGSVGGLAPIAGASPEADALDRSHAAPYPEVAFVGALFGAACVFFGIFPSPLFTFAAHAGRALGGLF